MRSEKKNNQKPINPTHLIKNLPCKRDSCKYRTWPSPSMPSPSGIFCLGVMTKGRLQAAHCPPPTPQPNPALPYCCGSGRRNLEAKSNRGGAGRSHKDRSMAGPQDGAQPSAQPCSLPGCSTAAQPAAQPAAPSRTQRCAVGAHSTEQSQSSQPQLQAAFQSESCDLQSLFP